MFTSRADDVNEMKEILYGIKSSSCCSCNEAMMNNYNIIQFAHEFHVLTMCSEIHKKHTYIHIKDKLFNILCGTSVN